MEKSKYMKPRTMRVKMQNEYYILAVSGGGSTRGLENGGLGTTGQAGDPRTAFVRTGYSDFN
ncbi:MAG: hypothetical protein IIU48_05160 [Prevotella sp.]|jgi:hypothetical protein|nr:hypothetical protein [Prevotella sp.]MBQ1627090.1 hypothetical protein [Prevotella sp.]MBQ1646721.1 hypothetical protein [Prevotella sp.]MBQ2169986.1 hypothetical protein [Prevotella sp.]MBQ2333197.1 hypothetical protein [Prevotella sp.]